jgi:hypothetical protein
MPIFGKQTALFYNTPERKTASLLAIPDDRITDVTRSAHLERIEHSANVYAFADVSANLEARAWYLWDTDTLISLCPLAWRWNIVDTRQDQMSQSSWWTIALESPDTRYAVELRNGQYRDYATYEDAFRFQMSTIGEEWAPSILRAGGREMAIRMEIVSQAAGESPTFYFCRAQRVIASAVYSWCLSHHDLHLLNGIHIVYD